MNEEQSQAKESRFENAEQMAALSNVEIENTPPLADRLDQLQSAANDGRGISSVRTLISFLRAGDKEAAEATARNEWDKIGSYSELSQLLIDEGIYSPIELNKYHDMD